MPISDPTGYAPGHFLTDILTMHEALPVAGFDLESKNGLVAPAGVPTDIIARLNAEIVRILRDPAVTSPGRWSRAVMKSSARRRPNSACASRRTWRSTRDL